MVQTAVKNAGVILENLAFIHISPAAVQPICLILEIFNITLTVAPILYI